MKIVLALGCFDGLHYGHLRHLLAAARYGKLCVALTSDAAAGKGPGRPVFPQRERLEMLKALRCVSYAEIVDSWHDAFEAIRPDIYVKGAEYEKNLPEMKYCRRHGIEIVFTKEPVYSSTKILTGELLNERIRAAGAGLA